MTHKPEVFGVIWTDLMLGPLTLLKLDAASAISAAQSMRAKGEGKITDCHAIRVPEGADSIEYLEG